MRAAYLAGTSRSVGRGWPYAATSYQIPCRAPTQDVGARPPAIGPGRLRRRFLRFVAWRFGEWVGRRAPRLARRQRGPSGIGRFLARGVPTLGQSQKARHIFVGHKAVDHRRLVERDAALDDLFHVAESTWWSVHDPV